MLPTLCPLPSVSLVTSMSEVDSYAKEQRYKPTGLKRYVLAFLTLLSVALIMVPPEFGLYEPISVQVLPATDGLAHSSTA